MKSSKVATVATAAALAAAISTYVATNSSSPRDPAPLVQPIPLVQPAFYDIPVLSAVSYASEEVRATMPALQSVCTIDQSSVTNSYQSVALLQVRQSEQQSPDILSLPSIQPVQARKLSRWDLVEGVGAYGSYAWAVCFEGRRQEESGNMAEADRFYQMMMQIIEMTEK